MTDFAKQLQAASQKIVVQTSEQAGKAAEMLFDRVVDDTPVLTGALKGAWAASQVAPLLADTRKPDPNGTATKAEIKAVIAGLPKTKDWTVFLANPKKYGPRIEYMSHSAKAPYGMVRINLAKLPALIRQAIEKGTF
ncbi:minor capsid protein [Hafnia phage yong3]|nr:minor capsid protein [Hafnia phage yong3]